MRTCMIQWIDQEGNPTPDSNEAVMMAFCHDSRWLIPSGSSDNKIVGYTDKIQQSFPICAEHYARVTPSMRYENGGAWSFGKVNP